MPVKSPPNFRATNPVVPDPKNGSKTIPGSAGLNPVYHPQSEYPSRHQKWVVEVGEWLCTQVLKLVPHGQETIADQFSLFNRKLLDKLNRRA